MSGVTSLKPWFMGRATALRNLDGGDVCELGGRSRGLYIAWGLKAFGRGLLKPSQPSLLKA